MHKSLGAVLLDLPLYGGIYILIYKYLYLYFSISLKIFHNLLLEYRSAIGYFLTLILSRNLAKLSFKYLYL